MPLEEPQKIKSLLVGGTSIACLLTLYILSNPSSSQPNVHVSPQNNSNLCTSDAFNSGQWVHQSIGLESHSIDGLSAFAGYHCNWDFAHRCYMRSDHAEEFNRSKAMLDYSWQPDSCTVLPFDARQFSKHLSDHPLLLVGDSITQLMFESLWCLTGQDMTSQNKDTHLSGGDSEMWAGQLVHRERENQDDAVSIAYIRSDYLVKLDDFSLIKPNEGQGYQIGVGNNFPWVHVLPRFKYIMINTGPHWHPDLKWGPEKSRQELLSAFEKAMTGAFEYLKKHVRQDQRVWVRSTPYGHAKCSQYTAPSNPPVAPTGQPGEYEWDMLEKFDFYWKDLIEKEKDPRFMFYNVSLSNLRGDAHSRPDSDCLHTCLPGPVDDWNKFLYHEMIKSIE